MVEAPRIPETQSGTGASGDVKRGRRPGLRQQFGEKSATAWNLGVKGVAWAKEVRTKWGTTLKAASQKVADKFDGPRKESWKTLGGGLAKLVVPATLLVLTGYASVFMLGGSWWGPPAALMAAIYGAPIFGRMLSAQFATTKKQPNAGFLNAVSRYLKRERIEPGPWFMEEKIVVKEKPQQGGAGAAQTPPGAA